MSTAPGVVLKASAIALDRYFPKRIASILIARRRPFFLRAWFAACQLRRLFGPNPDGIPPVADSPTTSTG
jgi:hypothetical protein